MGLDYTFSWSMYVNFQYAHGLFMDRGKEENINDYCFGTIEQKFFNDKLMFGLMGGVGIMDWDNADNNYGWLISPEVKLFPYDSVELAFGGFIIDSEGQGFFTMIEDMDMVYAKVKVDF